MRKPQPAKGKAKPASAATEPARATTAATEPAGATSATIQTAEGFSPASPVFAAVEPAASGKPQLTTAEAIAAELREAQESRPAPSSVTFAPDCLNPANAVPSRRRRPGANLAGFKAMGAEMFSS